MAWILRGIEVEGLLPDSSGLIRDFTRVRIKVLACLNASAPAMSPIRKSPGGGQDHFPPLLCCFFMLGVGSRANRSSNAGSGLLYAS